MQDNIGNFYMYNGKTESADRFLETHQAGHNITGHNMSDHDMSDHDMVYEVVRIINGVPLFFEEHYVRLKESLAFLNVELSIGADAIREQIAELAAANHIYDHNIKIMVFTGKGIPEYLMYFIKSRYPSRTEAENGVAADLFRWERENPNAKIVNNTFREKVNEKLAGDDLYEVLLVNNRGEITEGSKSNVFFVKGSIVITASGSQVLKGVTRKFIIDICRNLGLEIIEAPLAVEMLEFIDGLFISGTSIKVLPVAKVGNFSYNSASNPVIARIRDKFDSLVDDYVKCKNEEQV